MRHRGQGSVTPSRDGWRARLPAAYGRRNLGVFATEAEARAVLDAALRELAADPTPLGETLDAWAERALTAREAGDHKRRTCERDRTRWGTLVRGTLLGRTPLLDVDETDVRRWLDGLRRRDGGRLAPTTARNALTLVRVVLEAAREAGRIRSNPAADVRLSRPARRRAQASEWTWLRAEEINAVLSCEAVPIRSRAAYAVAIYAGLRAGELWGLRWEDVDDAHGVLHVRHSFEGAPKSHQVRDVPLLRPAREWLARWRAESERDGVRSRHGLVWPARDEAWHRDGYDAGWADRWRAAAGIERRVRLHDLRHTCASHLLQGTWAPELIARALRIEEVRDWLGHEDITTTQRYAHLCADGVRALVTGHPLDTSGHELDTEASHLRESNSRPTVYETATEASKNRAKGHGTPSVSRTRVRVVDALVRALAAHANGDPRRERMAVEAMAVALDFVVGMPARGTRAAS